MKRVGFIIDNWRPAPTLRALRKCGVRSLWQGAPRPTPMGIMRFGWIADQVNRTPSLGLHYELYRPFRHYDALVFLKSFDEDCLRAVRRSRQKNVAAVFEINVNYCDPAVPSYFEGMGPTPSQAGNALHMAQECDAVITASSWLCRRYATQNPDTTWIADNVNFDLVPEPQAWKPRRGDTLPLLWCGQAEKLFEFLAIEKTLRRFRKNLNVVIMTNDLSRLERIVEPYRSRLHALMSDLHTTLLPYRTVTGWLDVCNRGGIAISPRFLDNAYNLGHTEWKLSLPMACGRMALASPLESYSTVSELGAGRGLWICPGESDWNDALDRLLTGDIDWEAEENTARSVIRNHYSTGVIAARHAKVMRQLLNVYP